MRRSGRRCYWHYAKCEGYSDWHDGQPARGCQRPYYSHSYWVSESGEKMSKSLGNFLDPAAIDNYVNEFGLDALRYFLATRGPLGTTDSAFSADLFVETYNADLANTFGNSASRVTNMIGKYFDGKAPEAGAPVETKTDHGTTASDAAEKFSALLQEIDLSDGSDAALSLVRAVDNYIEETAPFKLAKDESKLPQVGTILYNCAEALRIASVLLWPFIPDACEAFWKRTGCGSYAAALKDGGNGDLAAWTAWGQLEPGTSIEKGAPLFPRYDVKKQG